MQKKPEDLSEVCVGQEGGEGPWNSHKKRGTWPERKTKGSDWWGTEGSWKWRKGVKAGRRRWGEGELSWGQTHPGAWTIGPLAEDRQEWFRSEWGRIGGKSQNDASEVGHCQGSSCFLELDIFKLHNPLCSPLSSQPLPPYQPTLVTPQPATPKTTPPGSTPCPPFPAATSCPSPSQQSLYSSSRHFPSWLPGNSGQWHMDS